MTKAASSAQDSATQVFFFLKVTVIPQCAPAVFDVTENIKTDSQGSNLIMFLLLHQGHDFFF